MVRICLYLKQRGEIAPLVVTSQYRVLHQSDFKVGCSIVYIVPKHKLLSHTFQ